MATKKKIKKVGIVVVPRKKIDDRKNMRFSVKEQELLNELLKKELKKEKEKENKKVQKPKGESDSTNYSRRNIKSYKKRTRISL
tara:strand:+ start:82 stop:333 length:252 start_codon:yes stop_codon:yes gene_type:complete